MIPFFSLSILTFLLFYDLLIYIRASKAALNAITKSMAVDLKNENITALALHPGYVKTAMTNNKGDLGPDESVADMLNTIEGKGLNESGKFYHRSGHELEW